MMVRVGNIKLQDRQALMNLLMKSVTLPSEDAVPIFHAERGTCQFVVLGSWQVENFVRIKERREYGPTLQDHSSHIHFPEFFRVR